MWLNSNPNPNSKHNTLVYNSEISSQLCFPFRGPRVHCNATKYRTAFGNMDKTLSLFVLKVLRGLTSDIERDRGAEAAVLFLMAGEVGAVVVINGFDTNAAFALLISVLELDSGAVSQPHQLLFGFTRAFLLANQRDDFIELDFDDTVAVDSWISLDFNTLKKTTR